MNVPIIWSLYQKALDFSLEDWGKTRPFSWWGKKPRLSEQVSFSWKDIQPIKIGDETFSFRALKKEHKAYERAGRWQRLWQWRAFSKARAHRSLWPYITCHHQYRHLSQQVENGYKQEAEQPGRVKEDESIAARLVKSAAYIHARLPKKYQGSNCLNQEVLSPMLGLFKTSFPGAKRKPVSGEEMRQSKFYADVKALWEQVAQMTLNPADKEEQARRKSYLLTQLSCLFIEAMQELIKESEKDLPNKGRKQTWASYQLKEQALLEIAQGYWITIDATFSPADKMSRDTPLETVKYRLLSHYLQYVQNRMLFKESWGEEEEERLAQDNRLLPVKNALEIARLPAQLSTVDKLLGKPYQGQGFKITRQQKSALQTERKKVKDKQIPWVITAYEKIQIYREGLAKTYTYFQQVLKDCKNKSLIQDYYNQGKSALQKRKFPDLPSSSSSNIREPSQAGMIQSRYQRCLDYKQACLRTFRLTRLTGLWKLSDELYAPAEEEIQVGRVYLYVESEKISFATRKTKASKVEYITIGKADLGEYYETVKAYLQGYVIAREKAFPQAAVKTLEAYLCAKGYELESGEEDVGLYGSVYPYEYMVSYLPIYGKLLTWWYQVACFFQVYLQQAQDWFDAQEKEGFVSGASCEHLANAWVEYEKTHPVFFESTPGEQPKEEDRRIYTWEEAKKTYYALLKETSADKMTAEKKSACSDMYPQMLSVLYRYLLNKEQGLNIDIQHFKYVGAKCFHYLRAAKVRHPEAGEQTRYSEDVEVPPLEISPSTGSNALSLDPSAGTLALVSLAHPILIRKGEHKSPHQGNDLSFATFLSILLGEEGINPLSMHENIAYFIATLKDACEDFRATKEVATETITHIEGREQAQRAKEAIRKETEAIRKETEAIRKETEAMRQETEAMRQETEAMRQETEAIRKDREAIRMETEAIRKDREAMRQEPEAIRKEAEAIRQKTEAMKKESAELVVEKERLKKEIEIARKRAQAVPATASVAVGSDVISVQKEEEKEKKADGGEGVAFFANSSWSPLNSPSSADGEPRRVKNSF